MLSPDDLTIAAAIRTSPGKYCALQVEGATDPAEAWPIEDAGNVLRGFRLALQQARQRHPEARSFAIVSAETILVATDSTPPGAVRYKEPVLRQTISLISEE
jgi:hypothetical protein